MRFITRLTFRAWLRWLMGLSLVAYLGGLALQGSDSWPVVDLWLSLVTSWLPAGVCWWAVLRIGFHRWEVLLSALAISAVAAADTYYAPWTPGWEPPFPSPGDLGYVVFYLLMLAMLSIVVRQDVGGQTSAVWLDCAVGSLGAASVLTILLSPVLASALTGSLSLATMLAVAYPLFDLLLIAAISGMVTVHRLRAGDSVVLLIVGLTLYAVADVVYALEVTADTYVVGSPLDAAWTVGVTLIALYVDSAERRDKLVEPLSPSTPATNLVISVAATTAGLGVLVLSSQTQLSNLAVVLAAVTLLAAAARTQIAFRQLGRMADLRRQATTDYLTGLPNRRALHVQAGLQMVGPHAGRHALLLLDLDRFKEVNDSLGHPTGDQLLVKVSARLGEHLQGPHLLVRLGGDEFAVLLEDAGHDEACAVATTLCAALALPFALQGVAVHSSVSIGIALYPGDGLDLNTLLRKADIAMYRAKASGDGHHAYSSADEIELATRLRMIEELRTALTSDQLVVYYQPKINLDTGDVQGVEALVRWDHPRRGLLYPDGFLDLVEEAGLMRAMTRVVLEIALDQAAVWRVDGRRLTIAVNLSASSLVDTGLPDEVASMLAARDLPADALQLEITEEFLMADRDRARAVLTRLRGHGVRISIDDFGTGYSSLSYLRDLPVDELKLDRSFVFPMADDARAAALVASTIELAHSLGLRMVAEGVENEITYAELRRLGCDQAQGFFMSRPLPGAELENWLDTWQASGMLTEIVTLNLP